MECLQYNSAIVNMSIIGIVLNLVISGMPSILEVPENRINASFGFKPCYKWNAFNT